MRPTFFVIGAAKSATTSLCDLISTHPDVFFCRIKEPSFFTYNFSKGFNWYKSLFADSGTAIALGEGSTTYSQIGVWPDTVDRLANWAPDAHIIYIVREPMERIQSHWIQWRAEGRIKPGPFVGAVRKVPALIDASLYWKQISAYRKFYPDDRILVLFFEDFITHPEATVREVFQFLGLSKNVTLVNAGNAINQSHYQRVPMITGHLLHSLPGYHHIRRVLPRWFLKPFSVLLNKPFTEQPLWDTATRTWALKRIKPDAKQFLRYYIKPQDYWASVADIASSE